MNRKRFVSAVVVLVAAGILMYISLALSQTMSGSLVPAVLAILSMIAIVAVAFATASTPASFALAAVIAVASIGVTAGVTVSSAVNQPAVEKPADEVSVPDAPEVLPPVETAVPDAPEILPPETAAEEVRVPEAPVPSVRFAELSDGEPVPLPAEEPAPAPGDVPSAPTVFSTIYLD